MQIKQGQNRFFIEDQSSKMLAEVTYVPNGSGRIIIDHTFVHPDLRGQGIAQKLIFEVVKLARENGLKITPLCSYAVMEFQRKSEYSDVLDE
jgi:predicted GNAT family acetyltransferase